MDRSVFTEGALVTPRDELIAVRDQLDLILEACDAPEVCLGFLLRHTEALASAIHGLMYTRHSSGGCPIKGTQLCAHNELCQVLSKRFGPIECPAEVPWTA